MPRFPRLPWPGRARGRAEGQDEAARPLGEAPMLPATLLASMRRLELRARRLVATELAGEYRSVFRGFGIEFAEAREYVPGDDVRLIDWNVTARMGSPWVKEYTEERELHVVCAVDISASQRAGRPEQGRRTAAAEVCALLTLSAAYSQDRAGLLTFAGAPERFVPPDKGTRHALRIVREVLDHAAPGSSGTSLAAACDYLGRVLRRRSLVFLISDFLDEGYVRALRDLAQRHEVIAVTLIDLARRGAARIGAGGGRGHRGHGARARRHLGPRAARALRRCRRAARRVAPGGAELGGGR